jgi:glycerophosphoryl diester phosphodiesterase
MNPRCEMLRVVLNCKVFFVCGFYVSVTITTYCMHVYESSDYSMRHGRLVYRADSKQSLQAKPLLYVLTFAAGILVSWLLWGGSGQTIPSKLAKRSLKTSLGCNWITQHHSPTSMPPLSICSHRCRSQEIPGTPSGSLAAYTALYNAGIHCFDIDYTLTADNRLLAAHPSDLLLLHDDKSGSSDDDDVSHTYPTIEEQLMLFNRLVQSKFPQLDINNYNNSNDDGQYNNDYDLQQFPLLLMMELKGPAFSTQTIHSINLAAHISNLTHYLGIWAPTLQDVAIIQSTGWQGLILKPYMDRDEDGPSPPWSPADLALYTHLGPSIHMEAGWLKDLVQRSGKKVIGWVVDSDDDVEMAVKTGMSGVISNVPIGVRNDVLDWIDECESSNGE